MRARIGIRREDKSRWERRVPLIPEHVRWLRDEHDIDVWLQPSAIRVFTDDAYRAAGARIEEDLSSCQVILGVKEIPCDILEFGHTYLFFAHVIKGQAHNMPMLQALLKKRSQLIDYEKVTDDRGARLVSFGHHAGLAGMVDTLWALGRRLAWEGIPNPFTELRQTHEYRSLDQVKAAISRVGNIIARRGLPGSIRPLICGFAGYGSVYRGATDIIELLPVEEIQPDEVADLAENSETPDLVYTVVFREEHTVRPIAPGDAFELADYRAHPERYRSRFESYLPHLTLLVNCVQWEEKYPRLVTKHGIRELYGSPGQPRLRVIGDISCDIEGAIEATIECTDPGDPVYVYDPLEDRTSRGVEGRGPVILAVDILPSELPSEASAYFSGALKDYLPAIAKVDYSAPFEELDLPPQVQRALIVHQGELTPGYRYLAEHLAQP
ncbi:MAG: bifunctional lysine ketoglutarate reductase /saccharopine dehydrogenase family protein [Anaerolineae bacterium]